jgi:TRAP-type mannitol/chloroaromatic compound transport system substrate-binding protein
MDPSLWCLMGLNRLHLPQAKFLEEMLMKRRQFLKTAGLAAAGTAAVAAPAIAQSAPEVKWRVTTSFPRSLDTIHGAAETVAKYVSDATDGKFQMQVFAGGEIVPALQALDAVSNGTVEACHTCLYYYWGKDPTFAFGTAVPFGLSSRQQNAWMLFGGGEQLMNEFLAPYKVNNFTAGNTGTQMCGWFRKEVAKPSDLDGLKMRIGGFGGAVLQKLGAVPQQIAGGDIYPSLEKGTIDAAEWIGPYDDEKLGFNKVAPFYYYPGWWEGGAMINFCTNLDKFNALPKNYQAILRAATAYANVEMQAKYDAGNVPALKRLVAAGTKLRPFSPEIMEACWKAANEVYADINAKNDKFKKVFDSYMNFRNDEYLWWQVAEFNYDNFIIRQRSKG